ncbi:MAG: ABC transporter ATP-binding protein [Cytophagales bacterium]|nr:ABC transporter ATP-binding protein [Cytophagales bacterium]
MTDIKGNKFDLQILKRLFQFVKPYIWQFYGLVFLTIAIAILAPTIPYLISYTIKHHISLGDYNGLLMTVCLMFGVLFLQAILQFTNTYLSSWLGQNVIHDIRIQLYQHILRLRLKFFDNTPIGQLVTRNVSDIETLSEVFTQGIAGIVAELLQLIVILCVMFYWNWQLTLISLSTLPLLLISTYIFKEKIKTSFSEVRTAVSRLNTFVQEHVTGMNVVQIFNTEKREYKKFTEINEGHRTAHLKSVKYYSIYFPVAEVISAIGIGLLVWYGARGIVEGFVSDVSTLIAFIMFINLFFRPIRLIADKFNTIQLGIISTERIIRLLDSEEHISDSGKHTSTNLLGDISFKNVWFAYVDEEYVLKNISFDVKQGETIAFVGATGAGKSSIINLLNRYYEINKGEIFMDGVNVNDYELKNLRENIGIVLQDVFLFSTSIRENITLGNHDISDEQIWNAAELVGAKKFMEKLPNQLDYNVQERGVSLSVGQRQLISFVRAMVYDPKILVLDEATSSVDSETETMIQQAIEKMMKGRTAVVIAHRLSTIQKADKIIVLDKGEIKEEGNHEDLLQLDGGYYRQLHEMQFS